MIGMGIFGGFFMILFWGGLIFLAVWGTSTVIGSGQGNSSSNAEEVDPRTILDQRYARGEISRDEYETIKQDLIK